MQKLEILRINTMKRKIQYCIYLGFLIKKKFFLGGSFLGLHPHHMEVPRLGVNLELQLLVYATATAMQDLSHVCDLHHSSWQYQIADPLSEARDQTLILMDTSWIPYC